MLSSPPASRFCFVLILAQHITQDGRSSRTVACATRAAPTLWAIRLGEIGCIPRCIGRQRERSWQAGQDAEIRATQGDAVSPPRLVQSSFFLPLNAQRSISTYRYTQEELYAIVADIDSYQHFLPYCTFSKVVGKDPQEDSGSKEQQTLLADLGVGFGSFQEKYRSRVALREGQEVTVSSSLTCSTVVHVEGTLNAVLLSPLRVTGYRAARLEPDIHLPVHHMAFLGSVIAALEQSGPPHANRLSARVRFQQSNVRPRGRPGVREDGKHGDASF